MAVDLEAVPAKEEQLTRQQGLSKWMQGLKEALPNPTVGGGGEPAADPNAQPDPGAATTTTAATAATGAEPAAAAAAAKTAATAAATAAATQTVTATETKADEATGEERWPRSAKEWKNFTTARKAKDAEYQKQISERDAKIKEFEARAAAPVPPEIQKELETLKKENEDFSKQLRLVAVTNHPKFKTYFETKTTGTLNRLKSCVPPDQIENVTRLLQQPDSDSKNDEINSLLENMNPLQQGRFIDVVNSLASIQLERDTEIARARDDYDQMMAQAKAQREQQQTKFNQTLEETIKGMQDAKAGRPEYQMREGETEWNAAVQKRIDAGKKLITGQLAPEVMFKAAFDAAAYPDVLLAYRAALGEVDKLKKQLTAMTAANPTVQSPNRTEASRTGTTNGNEPRLPKDARPMDYTQSWVKKFGETLRGEPG